MQLLSDGRENKVFGWTWALGLMIIVVDALTGCCLAAAVVAKYGCCKMIMLCKCCRLGVYSIMIFTL